MKLILTALGLLLGSSAFAATGQYSGMNLEEGQSLQLNLCSLKPGKSMSNYNRVMNSYLEWSRENDVELFVLRATPMMMSPAPNGGGNFDFMDMLIGPYEVSGRSWSAWLASEDGRQINGQWLDTADCRVAVNAAFIAVIDRETLSNSDTRVMSFNWCSRHEGVSWDQLNAKHRELAADWTSDSPVKAWSIVYPGLGSRNTPGQYAHLLSFADANGLMARQNAIANDGGWRVRDDYETAYAECVGENVYSVEVLNRPGN